MRLNVRKLIIFIVSIAILSVPVKFEAQAVDVDYSGVLRTVYCTTVKEIQGALKDARAGDRIIIAEGSYVGAWMTDGWFYSNASGTKENPIIIESENSNNPSELVGLRSSSGYVFSLVGSYWNINNLKFTNGQKGIMIDKGSYNIINGCEVYGVEMEGVHFRDGSSNNLLVNSKVYNTGTTRKGMGEGVYIGSDKGKWNEFVKECDNNIVRDCTIGPSVASESVDIKEGTTGTIIEGCTFIGDGISGENYADSFIDVKGNQAIIRNNKGYRNNNTNIVDAFQIHVQVEGWGIGNMFCNNDLYLDDGEAYILNNSKGSATVLENNRMPEGNMYKGPNIILEFMKEDINKDGKVNIEDLSIVASKYNKVNGDIEFIERCDINKDGIIDLFDLVYVSKCIY